MKTFCIELSSEPYGSELFKYADETARIEGFKHLAAQVEGLKDGIERDFYFDTMNASGALSGEFEHVAKWGGEKWDFKDSALCNVEPPGEKTSLVLTARALVDGSGMFEVLGDRKWVNPDRLSETGLTQEKLSALVKSFMKKVTGRFRHLPRDSHSAFVQGDYFLSVHANSLRSGGYWYIAFGKGEPVATTCWAGAPSADRLERVENIEELVPQKAQPSSAPRP